MSVPKLNLQFDGFNNVITRLKKIDGKVKPTVEKALKSSRDYVSPNLHKAIDPHNRTGKTEKAIKENLNPFWEGDFGKIPVGFDIKHGGLPSIFLMFGTKAHRAYYYGTPFLHPGTDADRKLYNSIWGKATQNKIKNIQSEIFYSEIRRLE